MSTKEVKSRLGNGVRLISEGKYSAALEELKVGYKLVKDKRSKFKAPLLDGIIHAFKAANIESRQQLLTDIAEKRVIVHPGYEHLLEPQPSITEAFLDRQRAKLPFSWEEYDDYMEHKLPDLESTE